MPQKLSVHTLHQFVAPTLADGSEMVCQVDRFPVSDKSLFKSNGFPCSDIGILDRFSRERHSKEEIEMIASRLQEIKAEPANKMSDDELIRTLRPAWCQTASEVAAFDESMYQYMSDKAASLRANKENVSDSNETDTSNNETSGGE